MFTLDLWFENVLSAVRDLSDAQYQERVWVRGDGPEVDSLTETYCRLFDDFQFDDFLSLCKKEKLITEKQIDALLNMRNKLMEFDYDDDLPDGDIIKDPLWHDIRELAKEVLDSGIVRRNGVRVVYSGSNSLPVELILLGMAASNHLADVRGLVSRDRRSRPIVREGDSSVPTLGHA